MNNYKNKEGKTYKQEDGNRRFQKELMSMQFDLTDTAII